MREYVRFLLDKLYLPNCPYTLWTKKGRNRYEDSKNSYGVTLQIHFYNFRFIPDNDISRKWYFIKRIIHCEESQRGHCEEHYRSTLGFDTIASLICLKEHWLLEEWLWGEDSGLTLSLATVVGIVNMKEPWGEVSGLALSLATAVDIAHTKKDPEEKTAVWHSVLRLWSGIVHI